MQSTTETCRFCGRPLPPLTVTVCGKVYTIGMGECGCPSAVRSRDVAKKVQEAEDRRARAEELDRKLLACGVPELYLHATHPEAANLAKEVIGGTGLYIHGNSGTGKTTLAMAMTRVLVGWGHRVEVTTAPKMIDALRDRRAEDRARTDLLTSVEVLVVDDLGMESPTDYASERLHHILSERLGSLRPTVYTSNYRRGEIAQRYAGSKAGVAIASRLNERTRAIAVYGGDRRLGNG